MNNENELIFLRFGNVAYPFTVDEALNGGACYRADARSEQIKTTISGIRNSLKKYAPLPPPSDATGSQGDDEGLLEALKLLLETMKTKKADLLEECDASTTGP